MSFMEKRWLKHYLPSVPAEVDVDQYDSLADLLKKSCRQFSHRPAFRQLGFSLTYARLDEKSRYFAAYLQYGLKLKKGDRIALMLPNSFQLLVALFGALRLGVVVTLVNPLDTARELAYQLKDSKAQVIVVLTDFLETVQSVYADSDLKQVIITDFPDLFPKVRRWFIHWVLRMGKAKQYWKRFFKHPVKGIQRNTGQKKGFGNALGFCFALMQGKGFVNYVDPKVQGRDLALLQYTGGTTGIPKGAMLTHRNVVANVLQCTAWVTPALKKGKERVLVALPLYHIFSLTICCFSFISIGGEGILVADPRRMRHLISVLRKEKPMVMVGVNTLFSMLLSHPNFKTIDFSHLHLTVSGGMKLQKKVADHWYKVTGKPILEGYGLTEASPVVCVNPVNLKKFNGSIGLPISSTEISIRSDSNEPLPSGQRGEIWVRGPQVMKGYWHRPLETQMVLTAEGWLKTGDVAYQDAAGFVYLVGRKKELIIVSGFNVYPNEVEEVMAAHPDVLEAAVVGVPNTVTGELVKAYVVRKSSGLTADALLQHCKSNLLPYKVPHQIEFVQALPKSPVGKVLKQKLGSG